MRKIEERMVHAVITGKSWAESNTQVACDDNGYYSVYLWGNCIARGRKGYSPDKINLCGWNSNTTRARLHALGVGVSSRNWIPYIGDRKIPTSGWVEVKSLKF